MGLHEYEVGRQLALDGPPFYALVQAAMRRADSENAAKLRAAWPEVWSELRARYDAPGGLLPGEATPDPGQSAGVSAPGEDRE